MDLVYQTTLLTQGGTLDQATADSLPERTKRICPYVEATRTNMTLNLKAVLDTPATA
jgi:osmotically inducible protein OsmC